MKPININQTSKALGRNIQHLDKENYNKLIKLFMSKIQELQEATISIADQRNIQVAQGIWLDYIGKVIGEKRLGRSDSSYRNALVLKIGVNTSDGTPDNIINLVKQMVGLPPAHLIEYPIAAFILSLDTPELQDASVWNLIDNIKPAGVEAIVVHNERGENLVPAWEVVSEFNIAEEPFLLDNEDFLLLDDGTDEDNYLIVTEGVKSFYGGSEYAIPLWGNEVPVKPTKGKLAQVISKNTTK